MKGPTADTNKHVLRFQAWRERVRFWLRGERGRGSALARHLQVRRQTVWRWFNQPWSKFPGWAAVATNVYYYEHVTPQADNELWQIQKKRGDLRLWHRSELPTVTPQADNPPQLVRRSADKFHHEETFF